MRAEWQNLTLGGWSEDDTVAIAYDPPSKVYTAYLNGADKCSWNDSGTIVPVGNDNRTQGFIFDMDGNLLTVGTGFRDILAYDRAAVAAPTGQLFILWRDAWSLAP